ncbi:DUF3300 domain-containing protein [Buttiauxella sp. S04-F03]|uniref:DUF3300 domain-containing protein n=1 Tax=Buttiauxella sp. S04-F03 TaxID=2904525 RepID=UPI001E5C1EE0|nr:DUF3300 domain-containing protein [Buttiauxella sp. S04-F03]MCE0813700.1 DUF3300 domain-containing protein [Buttiauxella sp. S04-F03]
MKLPFKPHILAIICSAGILAASGVLFVKSQTIEPAPAASAAQTAPVAAPATPTTPAPAAPVATAATPPTFSTAQLDQWVAPVALYPDPLLSQVLMASTYPANVVQAVQWSRDNPKMQGDAAIQAVANQPWDPSVKSLVAFPQLMALMGENPEWVQNLGDAFLAQPQDVMDSVQKLRLLAQQTGSLKTTPQQTVTSTPVTVNQNTTVAAPAPATNSSSSSKTVAAAPAETIIKIEPTDPQVVYVPNYNPSTVYGTWPNTAYPPTYLPPPPGQQFTNSFVNGLGFSLGVATTYAIFSNIDWDDDDYHHHDDYHGGGSNNNININNVNNFNRISGQNLQNRNTTWQHNPAYRGGVPYHDNAVAQRYHQTNVAGGLSATQRAPVNRDAQRQAAATQLQQNKGRIDAAAPQLASRDAQRKASTQQLNQIAQRNNYRGYDSQNTDARRDAAKQQFNNSTSQQRKDAVKNQVNHPTAQQQQRRETAKSQANHPTAQQQQRRDNVQQHRSSGNLGQEQRLQRTASTRSNAFSGNDSRSPSWQAQSQRGQQSLNRASHQQRPANRERPAEHREFHRR